MAQEEIYGTRDRSYSAWHRRLSTRRFVGIEKAQTLAMIDLDASLYIEYDDRTKDVLALIETAQDRGQVIKPSTVTRKLAERVHPAILAYVLLYRLSDKPNPADPKWPDIDRFRWRRIWPKPDMDWTEGSPYDWAEILVKIRNWSANEMDKHFPI